MEEWLKLMLTVLASCLASSGFWAFIQTKREKKDARTQMLIGLAHDRIMYLGSKYIEQGWILNSEYENLHEYLYKPYHKMGGNGTAERIMKEGEKLPIRHSNYEKGGVANGQFN